MGMSALRLLHHHWHAWVLPRCSATTGACAAPQLLGQCLADTPSQVRMANLRLLGCLPAVPLPLACALLPGCSANARLTPRHRCTWPISGFSATTQLFCLCVHMNHFPEAQPPQVCMATFWLLHCHRHTASPQLHGPCSVAVLGLCQPGNDLHAFYHPEGFQSCDASQGDGAPEALQNSQPSGPSVLRRFYPSVRPMSL